MVFSKTLLCSFLFIALLSFQEFQCASATATRKTARFEPPSCVNFCFAIDGSQSISASEFSRQLGLAREIARNVPSSLNPGFAAVQYGLANTPISPLSKARYAVMKAIRNATRQSSRGTFITGGINYCFSELFDTETELPFCPKSIIVVMGDGNDTLGTDPAERAALFEEQGGQVVSVAFGSSAKEKVLEDIAGENMSFDARGRFIRRLAVEILASCGIEPRFDLVET